MGIPALPLAGDLPVHPAGAGFRFPLRKLFPAFGRSAALAGSSKGSMEETLMGEKLPNSFRLPRWEGKRPIWSSWRVGSVRWRGVSHILAPSQGQTKPLGPPGSSFCLCVSCWAGQGICDPHAPPSPIRLLALSSWELWLGRRERQLVLLRAFPGLPRSRGLDACFATRDPDPQPPAGKP